ncbi:hypothetical protein B0T19DRAFT_188745 [Cercophora scortea]|uniref:Uncharacterized protein n=1 Tax=Cercophora scortea TaxID=314031 RepID=A0AAE0INY1_9PEZI|nr:hypothetical protein B0T19DRAFT_188745 [Cercophora scortea]
MHCSAAVKLGGPLVDCSCVLLGLALFGFLQVRWWGMSDSIGRMGTVMPRLAIKKITKANQLERWAQMRCRVGDLHLGSMSVLLTRYFRYVSCVSMRYGYVRSNSQRYNGQLALGGSVRCGAPVNGCRLRFALLCMVPRCVAVSFDGTKNVGLKIGQERRAGDKTRRNRTEPDEKQR